MTYNFDPEKTVFHTPINPIDNGVSCTTWTIQDPTPHKIRVEKDGGDDPLKKLMQILSRNGRKQLIEVS